MNIWTRRFNFSNIRSGFSFKFNRECWMINRQATITIFTALTWGWMISLGGFGTNAVVGQEFRIESQVYDENSKLPVSQNVTLFSQGVVFDFLMSDEAHPKPLEVVIYNSRNRTLVLLDPARQVRMEIPDLRLLRIVDGVRRETRQDKRTSFLVEDEFEQSSDWSTGWISLTSPQIIYRFKGEQPKDVSILPLYFEFLENFTGLAATDPTKIPPFPRMKLNQQLNRLGWIPTEVQITVNQNSLFREGFTAKSKHTLISQLSSKDHERIALAKQQWQTFKSVNLTEYRLLNQRPEKLAPKVGTVSYEEPVKNK